MKIGISEGFGVQFLTRFRPPPELQQKEKEMSQEKRNLRVVILGCGGSGGVPVIGNYWGDCDPNEPKNRRSRSSIYITDGTTQVVVDTGPDFREQMNRLPDWNGHLDGVIITHCHADHINGIDDIRAITFRQDREPVPIYARAKDGDELNQRIPYFFKMKTPNYPPIGKHITINTHEPWQIGTLSFRGFTVKHGMLDVLGLRIQDFAYSSDIQYLPDHEKKYLKGVHTWVLGGNVGETLSHQNIEDATAICNSVGVTKGILTHLNVHTDYHGVQKHLPNHIVPAYDGMEIVIA